MPLLSSSFFAKLLVVVIGYVVLCLAEDSVIITTKSGQLQGQIVQVVPSPIEPPIDVNQFTGIPFAEPPLGQLRFKKTRPVQPWHGVLNATKWAKACTQKFGSEFGDEDCLYLNIWVASKSHPLSTFVFIHGGSFVFGSTKETIYNGRYLAGMNGIIVATIQYRLGSLGMAYLGNDDIPGNMGLWDQLEALKWIHDNIEAFGGNSSDVTLAGESAGAISVTWHLLSKNSRNYFQRVIVHSGATLSPRGRNSAEVAFAGTNAVFDQICPQSSLSQKMKCLRDANPKEFPLTDSVAAAKTYESILRPVMAGDFLPPGDLVAMFKSGNFYKVPLLIGSNRDEGSLFVPMNGYPPVDSLTFDDYNALMFDRFKQYGGAERYPVEPNQLLIDTIKFHYWPQNHEGRPRGIEVFKAVYDAYGEMSFTCPTYAWANITAVNDVGNVFAYYFTHQRNNSQSSDYMGVKHADELPFLFGQPFASNGGSVFTEAEKQLSRVMMTYWSNFIKFGDPNGDVSINSQLPKWPTFVGDSCSEQYFEINTSTLLQSSSNNKTAVICQLKERNCLFWQDYLPRLAAKLSSANCSAAATHLANSNVILTVIAVFATHFYY